jgi:hypothetical protein
MRLFGHTGERLRPSAGSTRLWIVLVLFAAVGVTMTATASLTSPAHVVLVRLVGLAVLALAALAAQAAQVAMAAMAAPDGRVAVRRAASPGELAEDADLTQTVRLLRLHVRTLEATLETTSADFGKLRGELVQERDDARADELQRVAVVVRAMPRSTGLLTDPMTVDALARVEAAIRRLSTSWSFERPPLAEPLPGALRETSHLPRAEREPEIEPSARGATSLAPDPAPRPTVDTTILPVPAPALAPVLAPVHGRRWHRGAPSPDKTHR